MKKIIFVLLILLFLSLFLVPTKVLAWDDCPFGKVNDSYPGDCGRYVDTDKDGICDHSQPAPEDRNITNITDNKIIEEEKKITDSKGYRLFPISLFLITFYSISYILSKKKVISVVTHRKIWNILLLITSLISGISGILLVVRINFDITIPLPFNILFWHVEAGIAMFVISVFHILWHWAYFKNIFKIKK